MATVAMAEPESPALDWPENYNFNTARYKQKKRPRRAVDTPLNVILSYFGTRIWV